MAKSISVQRGTRISLRLRAARAAFTRTVKRIVRSIPKRKPLSSNRPFGLKPRRR